MKGKLLIHDTLSRATEMNRFWWTCAEMTADTQSVMTMRMLGMSGAWSVPRGENNTMFEEKVPAFTEAMVAGALTALSGRGPDRVMQAVIEPLSQKVRSNRARLAQRGPAMPGFPKNQDQIEFHDGAEK